MLKTLQILQLNSNVGKHSFKLQHVSTNYVIFEDKV